MDGHTAVQRMRDGGRRTLRELAREYDWVHTWVGITGNTAFVVGSVLFLANVSPASLYFFLAGSSLMWVGSVGSALAKESQPSHAGEGRER